MPAYCLDIDMTELYAIIRVRGSAETRKGIEDTLSMLNLTRANHCVVMKKSKSLDGMLRKVSGYITWGPISQEMLEKLVAKRGMLPGGKRLDDKQAKEELKKLLASEKTSIKKVFRLHPPSGGYKSVKRPFPEGDLGSRGDKINALLERMV